MFVLFECIRKSTSHGDMSLLWPLVLRLILSLHATQNKDHVKVHARLSEHEISFFLQQSLNVSSIILLK